MRKAMREFRRKFWYFFAAALFFTGFFGVLQAPEAWGKTVLLTVVQAVVGIALFPWMLRQLSTFSQAWRVVFLLLPLGLLALHITLGTALSGLAIIGLWIVFIHSYLWQAEVRDAFGQRHHAALQTVSEVQ
jgi:hypothetical protein